MRRHKEIEIRTCIKNALLRLLIKKRKTLAATAIRSLANLPMVVERSLLDYDVGSTALLFFLSKIPKRMKVKPMESKKNVVGIVKRKLLVKVM